MGFSKIVAYPKKWKLFFPFKVMDCGVMGCAGYVWGFPFPTLKAALPLSSWHSSSMALDAWTLSRSTWPGPTSQDGRYHLLCIG